MSATKTVGRIGRRRAAAAACLLAALALFSPARAAGVEGIAGWEGDGYDQGYGFAMLGAFLAGGTTVSWPLRISGSYLYYNYADGGATVRVQAPGVAATTGIRWTGARGSIGVAAGGEIRRERREREATPVTVDVVPRGGFLAQGEGEVAWGRRLHPFFLVSYAGAARYTYGRAGLRCQLSNLDWSGPRVWSLGLEGVGQGNRDTDAFQGGAFVDLALVPSRISVSLHGGFKESAAPDGGRRRGGYLAAGLYRRF
jgi:hypothetical protein